MRLIDVDAFLEKMKRTSRYFDVKFDIEEMPTIDAVPVVRCRDCIYFEDSKMNKKGFLICPASGMEITDMDFCSYGERKEGAK